jgi:molybdate transport system substrate-binding protein
MRVKTWRVGRLSILVAGLLVACNQLAPPPQATPPTTTQATAPATTLLVAAAASLQKPLQEIAPLYHQAHPRQTINYNFAASGALAQQIEQGAPADIFIAAASKPMQALQAKGLLASGMSQDLLTNQLVLITPKPASVALTDFQQLVRPDVQRIAVGEPRSVPAGQYATEVLQNLGILAQVQSKFVFGNNVKSVLTAVETGDVDAGIVYATDAQGADRVTVVATADAKLHSPMRYPIAVLPSSQLPAESKQYVEFLQGDKATAIFKKYGFGTVKP